MTRIVPFSERLRIVDVPIIQATEIDSALRTALWNAFHESHERLHETHRTSSQTERYYRHYWKVLSWTVDVIPENNWTRLNRLKAVFLESEWPGVYDFIEHSVNGPDRSFGKFLCDAYNVALDQHRSAFRFVGTQLVRLTTEEHLQAISKALEDTDEIAGARAHIQTAIRCLFSRSAPDFPNAITESISAVESVCRFITNDKKAVLSDALRVMRASGRYHTALLLGFEKIYAYTSDEHGLRHGGIDVSTADRADAEFMLVACSAFVSFVLAKHGIAGHATS